MLRAEGTHQRLLSAAGAGGRGGNRGWMDDRSAPCNRYAAHPALLKAVLLAALYPNLAVMDDESAPGGCGWVGGCEGGEVGRREAQLQREVGLILFSNP